MCRQEVRTLGLKDAQALGNVKINLEWQQMTETEDVRRHIRGQTQEEIDLRMTELVKPFQQVFQGIGTAGKVGRIRHYSEEGKVEVRSPRGEMDRHEK